MKTERGESLEKGVNHDSGTRRQKAKLIANLSRANYSSKYVSSGRSAPDMQAPACLPASPACEPDEPEKGKKERNVKEEGTSQAHWHTGREGGDWKGLRGKHEARTGLHTLTPLRPEISSPGR